MGGDLQVTPYIKARELILSLQASKFYDYKISHPMNGVKCSLHKPESNSIDSTLLLHFFVTVQCPVAVLSLIPVHFLQHLKAGSSIPGVQL